MSRLVWVIDWIHYVHVHVNKLFIELLSKGILGDIASFIHSPILSRRVHAREVQDCQEAPGYPGNEGPSPGTPLSGIWTLWVRPSALLPPAETDGEVSTESLTVIYASLIVCVVGHQGSEIHIVTCPCQVICVSKAVGSQNHVHVGYAWAKSECVIMQVFSYWVPACGCHGNAPSLGVYVMLACGVSHC